MNNRKAYAALMKFYPLALDNLDGEEWKDIAGYETLYQVSTFGRVKRLYRTSTPRIIKPEISVRGYFRIVLWKGGKPKKFSAHRLVAETFIPNPEGKPYVNHIDGGTLNNFINNLEWCTAKENNQHAVNMGLIKSGEDNYLAALTNEQVEYVRKNPCGLTCENLAKQFNVSSTTIRRAQVGQTYKNASGTTRNFKHRLPKVADEIREKILAEYVKGSRYADIVALAEKYGLGKSTVWQIVKSK